MQQVYDAKHRINKHINSKHYDKLYEGQIKAYFEGEMFRNYCNDENRITNQSSSSNTIAISSIHYNPTHGDHHEKNEYGKRHRYERSDKRKKYEQNERQGKYEEKRKAKVTVLEIIFVARNVRRL